MTEQKFSGLNRPTTESACRGMIDRTRRKHAGNNASVNQNLKDLPTHLGFW